MAEELTITTGSTPGAALDQILCADDIQPGAGPSYELCKLIFTFHPLGAKMAEAPIAVAQSMPREIVVAEGPEEECKKAFNDQWALDKIDETIKYAATLARVYGIATLALLEKDGQADAPLDVKKLAKAVLSFNVLDPLNTAGSLVLNQDPNALDFQKHKDVSVNGRRYHRSRTVTLMNEQPIYIAWSSSAFGFVGRSVYQRALYPLKSFIQTMRADDMVARKVGLIVAVLKMASNVIDRVMAVGAAFKRRLLKVGQTDNVVSIAEGESVTSLDLTNLEGPLRESRVHILENIAAADDMPAKMLNNETFAAGFGEGTEDAKRVASYIETKRAWMRPLYDFMDMVVQRRAWNQEFYATVKRKFPEEYGDVSYEQAFYRWQNSFSAIWPSLIREPESELVRVEETKFKTAIALAQVVMPECDPDNRATVVNWLADTVSACKKLFPVPLVLDYEALAAYTPEQNQALKEPDAAPPFSGRDSADGKVEDVSHRIVEVENYLRRLPPRLLR
ncbi:MAG: anti-CBASS Acb1 family protein, partial [Terriglobales bacterium]